MTRYGDYSIARKTTGSFHVRGRECGDLENLITGVPLPEVTIHETPDTDDAMRLIVDGDRLSRNFRFLAASIDYDDF